MPSTFSGRRAFTLVELLVVIAVVAALLTMLLPGLSKSRAVAKRMICAANLRQMGTMSALYIADFKGAIPSGTTSHANDVDEQMTSRLLRYTAPGYSGSPSCPLKGTITPVGIGLFYWQRYLPTIPRRGKAGIIECPDSARSTTGRSEPYEAEINGFQVLSLFTSVYFAPQLSTLRPTEGGSPTDQCCYNSSSLATSYMYRGKWLSPANYNARNIQAWKPSNAVMVDWEFVFRMTTPQYYSDAHGNGLNILFIDGHAKFGGFDILNPLASTATDTNKPMVHKPFVYFSMNTNGQTFANATGNGGAASHSGWSNGGTSGTVALWDYYESF